MSEYERKVRKYGDKVRLRIIRINPPRTKRER